jgi:hypothetical protein
VPDHVYFKGRGSRFIALRAAMAHRFGQTDVRNIVGKT